MIQLRILSTIATIAEVRKNRIFNCRTYFVKLLGDNLNSKVCNHLFIIVSSIILSLERKGSDFRRRCIFNPLAAFESSSCLTYFLLTRIHHVALLSMPQD